MTKLRFSEEYWQPLCDRSLAAKNFCRLASRLSKSQKTVPDRVCWAARELGRFYRSAKPWTRGDLWQMFSDWDSWIVLTKKTPKKLVGGAASSCSLGVQRTAFQICSISIHEQSTVPRLYLMVLSNNRPCRVIVGFRSCMKARSVVWLRWPFQPLSLLFSVHPADIRFTSESTLSSQPKFFAVIPL